MSVLLTTGWRISDKIKELKSATVTGPTRCYFTCQELFGENCDG